MMRRRDPEQERALKEAVRNAYEAEEEQRDVEFEAQMKRLLDQMDEFTKDAGNA